MALSCAESRVGKIEGAISRLTIFSVKGAPTLASALLSVHHMITWLHLASRFNIGA